MVQAIGFLSHSSDDSKQLPSNIPLSFSEGSSLLNSVKPRLPTPSLESPTIDLPLVAINYFGTSPSTSLPPSRLPPPSQLKEPSFVLSNPQLHASGGRNAFFGPNGLEGLQISCEGGLDTPPCRNSEHWKMRSSVEEGEDGSDLELVNVSPITYIASGLVYSMEKKFAHDTEHLSQVLDVVAKAEAVKMPQKEKRFTLEIDDSEEVIVVPDLRPREESPADQRRRRRRLERRSNAASTSVVRPDLVQIDWAKRA